MSPNDGESTRERILDLLEEKPGLHKSALCRELGIGWGTVCYHLRVMKTQGHIRTMSRGREVHVFPSNQSERRMRWILALRDDDGVASALHGHPGRQLTDLTRELGLSRKIIRRHLSRLDEAGIVEQDGTHRRRYSLAPDQLDDLGKMMEP